MYIRCIRFMLFIVLTISWLEHANSRSSNSAAVYDDSNSSSSSSSNNLLLDELTISCPSDGIPVCGIRYNKQYVIFPNECLLEEVNKDLLLGIQHFKKIPLKQCIYGCELQCPKVYRPICALNLKTYEKKVFLNLCEVTEFACKTNIDYLKLDLKQCENPFALEDTNKLITKRSKSSKRKPIPCTNIFKPVCASYLGVKSTFRNECLLNAENINNNRDWRIVKKGICAEDYSNVRQTKEKPAKPHSIKKRSYVNNFVDFKSESREPNHGLFVYMPNEFQTQFLNHDIERYQQSMQVNKEYDELLNKIISLPMPDEGGNAVNHENRIYGQTENKPMPFVQNRMDFNYLPNENFAKNSIPAPKPSDINTFIDDDDNKEYYYTLKKVESNREILRMDLNKLKSMPDTENNAFEQGNSDPESVVIVSENIESIPITENIVEATATISTPLDSTTITQDWEKTTVLLTDLVETTSQPEIVKKDKNSKQFKECKFGSMAVCGVLPDGTVQTFVTICEMMTANIYLTSTWTKLHEGECENCIYSCERDYNPICVTRNGVNYTMVNDCYFNMGICMDKKSKWRKISTGECKRYTRILDKYINSKPGFPYTSSYFAQEAATTTKISSAEPASTAMPDLIDSDAASENIIKPLRLKLRKSKTSKSASKRVVNRRSSNNNAISRQDIGLTTENPRLSLYGPQTESYIMRLVIDKAKKN